MKEGEIVEGRTELIVIISSSLMATLIEREQEMEEVPFDQIVEDLLIRGFAFDKIPGEISLLMKKLEDEADALGLKYVTADKHA